MDKVRVFAPATVGNVGPGFDVLGFALENIGDSIELIKRDDSDLVFGQIVGADLPTDPKENLMTVVLKAMLQELGYDLGLTINISKQVIPGSGLGSSGSSAAGAAVALNLLLGEPFNRRELVEFAMLGEEFVSLKPHADNVAPCIYGGLTLIRGYNPLEIIPIPLKSNAFIAIIHPQIEIKTAIAKKLMRDTVNLNDAVTQWGNVGGLVAGMIMGDLVLAGKCMTSDLVAEPVRSLLIPFYGQAKEVALSSGALGFNISGSGPAMFALCPSGKSAELIAKKVSQIYRDSNIEVKSYQSSINMEGVKKIDY